MKIHRIDHVGIVVNDLAAAKAFFLDFGLEVRGEGNVGGAWVERIIGLDDVQVEFVMMGPPDGGTNIEVIQFQKPIDEKGIQDTFANTLGMRHIAFVVDDIEGLVAKLKTNGTELVGEIVNYENVFKLCYVRGPEGIILELAEQLEA
jgi:catechol 2,3-dioxygenase-like lactoylglutathione lyase family enzyme